MSINWHLDAQPAPAILVLPPDAASLDEAHAAIELWEHYSGKRLDPTQRLVVEVMMAQRSDGTWAASTTGREMPRQNGKGDEVEVVELWGLVQRGEAILHTIHDAVLLASNTQQRMLSVLERPDLRQRIKRKWQGTGQQMIEMRNGGVIYYRTRTGGGGRGVDDIDRLVVDEAQHATEEHLAAVSPTLLANPNSQMNVLGTSGLDGHSDWWWGVRKRALSGDPGSFGYVGHTAESVHLDDAGLVVQESVDVHDRSLWAAANPFISAGRGRGMDFLEEQLLRMGEDSFAREHLGVWDPPVDAAGGVIDIAAWQALKVGKDERPLPVVFAVEVSDDRKWSSISLAGRRTDGRVFVQVVESERGTGWLPDRLVELREKWSPLAVGLNPSGPSGSLLPALGERGIEATLVSGREYGAACGMFVDHVEEKKLAHSDQRLLSLSLEAVAKRKMGDSFVWVARDRAVDIAPLRGVTVALFVLAKEAARPAPKKRSGVVMGIR